MSPLNFTIMTGIFQGAPSIH